MAARKKVLVIIEMTDTGLSALQRIILFTQQVDQ